MKKFFTEPAYRVEALIFTFSLLFSASLLIYTWKQPWAYRHTTDGIGIAAFPTIFLVGMFLFGGMCLFGDYVAAKRGAVPPEGDVSGMNWRSTVIVCAIAILSPLAIFLVDPLLYVALLCLVILFVGHIRRWKLLVIPTAGLVVFIYVFMIRIADVFFPVTWFF